jgi:hypothetical protein
MKWSRLSAVMPVLVAEHPRLFLRALSERDVDGWRKPGRDTEPLVALEKTIACLSSS